MSIGTQEDQIVRVAKALSDRARVRILQELTKRGSISCGDAEKIVPLSQPTISHHLKILVDAGLVTTVKNGRHVLISVNKKALQEFAALLPAAGAR
jgi:ArsR family transcriptional regulator, arsenate/arsenite/antimonite-responsive transcriptional repressor